MVKPRTPVGTHGEIRCYPQPSGSYRAETLFRDADGQLRPVKRSGKSKAEAKNNLKLALIDRELEVKGRMSGSTKFPEAAALWLAEVHRIRKASTFDTHRRRLHGRVLPAFQGLTLREIDVPTVHRWLRGLEAEMSANAVRGCRTVLGGILGFAVQQGAIKDNPVPKAGRIYGRAKPARALTPAERADLLNKLDTDPKAIDADLPDLIRYWMGTGTRLSEALALRWCRIDLDAGVSVHGDNLITATKLCLNCGQSRPRHTGRVTCLTGGGTYLAGPGGLMLVEPKTPDGYRVLPLPDFVVTMLRVRWPGPTYFESPVFPNCLGTWRDRNNTGTRLREFRKRAGFEWLTSHVFRKTAITILDQQGLSARAIAGYAGHARPSITQDVYMAKQQQDPRAASALHAAYQVGR